MGGRREGVCVCVKIKRRAGNTWDRNCVYMCVSVGKPAVKACVHAGIKASKHAHVANIKNKYPGWDVCMLSLITYVQKLAHKLK